MYMLAQLSDEQLTAINDYEGAAGIKLVAMSEVEVCPAPLDAEQVQKLHELEEELDVCLVALN